VVNDFYILVDCSFIVRISGVVAINCNDVKEQIGKMKAY
jgi:hypothetical protein